MPKFDYVRAGSVGEAVDLLNDPAYSSQPLAGGTDVIPLLKRRNISCRCLISVKKIPELKMISLL